MHIGSSYLSAWLTLLWSRNYGETLSAAGKEIFKEAFIVVRKCSLSVGYNKKLSLHFNIFDFDLTEHVTLKLVMHIFLRSPVMCGSE